MSWNLDLCLSPFYEPQTPFRYLVFPTQPTPSPLRPFHRFADLPAEIYLRILQFCDASTLFQLMRTCSYIRADASKIFWTQQDIWYHCDHSWVDALWGGRVGMVEYCTWFASHVTQVEVDLFELGEAFKQESHLYLWKQQSPETKARFFWDAVQRLFPAVKLVALTGRSLPRDPPLDGQFDEDYTPISTVVGLAPSHITIFVGFTRKVDEALRFTRLWQVNPGPSWVVVEDVWAVNRVLMPHRRYSDGPVSDFMRFLRVFRLFRLEWEGLFFLVKQTYVRYANGLEIECPVHGCDTRFTELIEWRLHFNRDSHSCSISSLNGLGRCRYYRGTPAEVKAVLEARYDHVAYLRDVYQSLWSRIYTTFWAVDAGQRVQAFDAFVAHLREEKFLVSGESVYATPAWDQVRSWFYEGRRMP